MKKLMIVLGILCIASSFAYAADVGHKWDAVDGADGYRLYQSVDNGVTWVQTGSDVTTTTMTAIGVPDTGLVLFRVSAFNASGETIREWSGSWYNGDWKPLDSPSGNGIE